MKNCLSRMIRCICRLITAGFPDTYRKNQLLFHELHGISVVEDIISKVLPSCEVVYYYRLRSLCGRQIISYVAVDQQAMYLRPLMNTEHANIDEG